MFKWLICKQGHNWSHIRNLILCLWATWSGFLTTPRAVMSYTQANIGLNSTASVPVGGFFDLLPPASETPQSMHQRIGPGGASDDEPFISALLWYLRDALPLSPHGLCAQRTIDGRNGWRLAAENLPFDFHSTWLSGKALDAQPQWSRVNSVIVIVN